MELVTYAVTKLCMESVRHCYRYYVQIGFEWSNPVLFFLFRILTVCHIFKCYGIFSKKATMTFTAGMLKQMF